jgi:hypothetical protein
MLQPIFNHWTKLLCLNNKTNFLYRYHHWTRIYIRINNFQWPTTGNYSRDQTSRRIKMAGTPSGNSFTRLPESTAKVRVLVASPVRAPRIIQHSRNTWQCCFLKTLKSAKARLASVSFNGFVSIYSPLYNCSRTPEECVTSKVDLNPGFRLANLWFK